eukprot:1000843-Pyramimonas_sp.AAC.1
MHWLAQDYTAWVAAVEEATIIRHHVQGARASKVRGRAQGHLVTWEQARATPDRPHLRDPASEWWRSCAAPLARAGVLRRAGRASDLGLACAKMEELLVVDCTSGKFAIFHAEGQFTCWPGMIAELNRNEFQEQPE